MHILKWWSEQLCICIACGMTSELWPAVPWVIVGHCANGCVMGHWVPLHGNSMATMNFFDSWFCISCCFPLKNCRFYPYRTFSSYFLLYYRIRPCFLKVLQNTCQNKKKYPDMSHIIRRRIKTGLCRVSFILWHISMALSHISITSSHTHCVWEGCCSKKTSQRNACS